MYVPNWSTSKLEVLNTRVFLSVQNEKKSTVMNGNAGRTILKEFWAGSYFGDNLWSEIRLVNSTLLNRYELLIRNYVTCVRKEGI